MSSPRPSYKGKNYADSCAEMISLHQFCTGPEPFWATSAVQNSCSAKIFIRMVGALRYELLGYHSTFEAIDDI